MECDVYIDDCVITKHWIVIMNGTEHIKWAYTFYYSLLEFAYTLSYMKFFLFLGVILDFYSHESKRGKWTKEIWRSNS